MTQKTQQLGCLPLDPASPDAQTEWRASWLKDPLFADVPYRDFVHSNRCSENNGEIQNVHTFFRKVFELPQGISSAKLYVTADDCYKLYLNGEFVGLGPAQSYPFAYCYNAYDVTPLLKEGANCIGLHCFYQGMHSLTFVSADNLEGMILQLEIECTDGSQLIIVSDGTWKCRQVDAYEARQVLGYQTAFSEHIDLRKLPVDWTKADFDDSEWGIPHVGTEPVPEIYTLIPQSTPPVAVYKKAPLSVVKKGDGHYFIDFGSELTGETAFRVSGPEGHEVEIRHGEELDGPETVRYNMRCNCEYQEFCTLSGRENEVLTFFDYKGFRYVEVLNWPEELTSENVWAHERHYPFPENVSEFTCSNQRLNDIWELCRNGVRVGTIDTYLDCPTREKGGFMGDGFITGMSHLVLTGDARILRKFLKDVANTSHICKGLLSTAPNRVCGELAEYSLLWPVLLEYYYQWTADLDFLKEMMPTLKGLLEYYAEYENEQGLLQDVFSEGHAGKRYSILVDWPKNLRDDYDDPYLMGDRKVDEDPSGQVNTMLQGFYAYALQTVERLAVAAFEFPLAGQSNQKYQKIKAAVNEILLDPATKLYYDTNNSKHCSLHANVMLKLAGLVPEIDRDKIVTLIRAKRLNCGVYFSYFVLKALCDGGQDDLAYDLMTSDDEHSWNSMLEAGATTCMEAWAPDLKWNTSWCHPWSSAPIPILAHGIMGLKPVKPGWNEFEFQPKTPHDLESATIAVMTPKGQVTVTHKRGDEQIVYNLTVPDGCKAHCRFGRYRKEVVETGSHEFIVTDSEITK